ncbi:hypothetical protein E8E68_00305 [Pseudomonas sp. BN607]|nr:hypothetical protein [Pseudomonas sp. BN607]
MGAGLPANAVLNLPMHSRVNPLPQRSRASSRDQWCSRVARNLMSGQRSSINARLTRVGAR